MTDTIEHTAIEMTYGTEGPCVIKAPRNGDDRKLLWRYREVPHECSDPECPGNVIRKRLLIGTADLAIANAALEESTRLLTACRAELEVTRNELDAALCEGDTLKAERGLLRALRQRTLDWMRETDSSRTVQEVINDLQADLEATTNSDGAVPTEGSTCLPMPNGVEHHGQDT